MPHPHETERSRPAAHPDDGDDDPTITKEDWRRIDRALDEQCLVRPGRRVRLGKVDPGYLGSRVLRRLTKDELKAKAKAMIAGSVAQIAAEQELLAANDVRSLLLVFQAMDAAGKDGTIKHVMSGINPAGCRVVSFKAPSKLELDHNWLWRVWMAVPERGQICIFNRSHYEDVLVTRVHPELLDQQRLPPGRRGKGFWQSRFEDIVAFERHLARNGTVVLKFFLHVSKAEQKRRFIERLEEREKNWKFSVADLAERAHWDEYMVAYEDALQRTSSDEAPWFVVPADYKWVTRVLVARQVARALEGMRLRPPELGEEERARLDAARAQLESE